MMPALDGSNHVGDGQDYKQKYKTLKRKLKFLLYEQEYFQENLRRTQKKLLRVTRDKSFLLDRLLHYEQVEASSSDEDNTASSSEASDEGYSKMVMDDSTSHTTKSKKPQLVNHSFPTENFHTYLNTSKTKEGTSRASTGPQSSSKLVPCKYTSNGRQCQEMVSKRSKSGYCSAHRTVVRITKQGISGPGKTSKNISNDPAKDNIKAEQLESLHRLSESSTASHVPQATEQLPPDVFNMDEEEQESENEDSTGSASIQGNIYEGDDDLVIDLPE